METQKLIAQRARDAWGFIYAETCGAGRPGVDILNTPGLAVEVKATKAVDMPDWLRQATRNARAGLPDGTPADLPLVVYRPQGYGPATVGDWPVIMRLEDAEALLRAGGYFPVNAADLPVPAPAPEEAVPDDGEED
jgi:hypothetical protein